MPTDETLSPLQGLAGVTALVGEAVARHGNLRLGGEVQHYIVVDDEAGLVAAVRALRASKVKLRSCHPFSDIWAREEGLSGALLRLGSAFAEVEAVEGGIRAGSAAPMALVGLRAARLGCARWAPLRTWPGTLGAWVEAQSLERLAPGLLQVRAFAGRSVRQVDRDGISRLPRTALPVSFVLALEPAPGFDLPPPPPPPGAICALDDGIQRAMTQAGLPGLRLRRIRLCREQPGVVINLGGARSTDLDLVLRLAKERLAKDHGLTLEIRLQPAGRPVRRRRGLEEGWND